MTDNEIIKSLEEWSERGMSFCNIGMPEFARNILSLINRQKAEIERLKDKYECIYQPKAMIKAETVKEFAERLKMNFFKFGFSRQMTPSKHIDNLVAEMVGDQNA